MKPSGVAGKQGFTLVEIMIVVAIIAVLAAIALPSFLRARKRSQATVVLNDLRLLSAAVDQYAIDNGKMAGATCAWTDAQNYLKTATRLYNSNCTDIFGNSYGGTTLPPVGEAAPTISEAPAQTPATDAAGSFMVDGAVEFSGATFTALSDVAPADFWSPFPIGTPP